MAKAPSQTQARLIYRVAVPSPLRRVFDYLPPREHSAPADPGVRVRVPFGRRQLIGILLECTSSTDIETSRLRHVSAVLDEQPLFSTGLFQVLCWAIRYYQHPPGEVFSTALPTRIRNGESLENLEEWWQAKGEAVAVEEQLSRAPRQWALWQTVHEGGGLPRARIIESGFSSTLLRELHHKLLLEPEQRRPQTQAIAPAAARAGKAQHLNAEQKTAVHSISASLHTFGCFLLDGVTGSGKTEVYMQIMAQVLKSDRQCLVLVPEIGLTPQTLARFRERFSETMVALHSGMTDPERAEAWRLAREGSARLIIGTRSAIFTPLASPGLIIVDEEHDSSFKQQDGFRYSARDLAVLRGREEDVPVILGSATPSLESLHNAATGKFRHLKLDQRAGGATPARMVIVDMQGIPQESIFSESARLKMTRHLEEGNQVLVFMNRRGFAPVLHCLACGWVAECANCVARLTVHSKPVSLRCHHCEQISKLPKTCPHCGSHELGTLGLGTQQIEAALQREFPDIPVLRVDRDTTRSRARLHQLLDDVARGQPCLLLGTQMLAKGHHFPGITLVVVVDADSGLFSADFRGQEQMAQTIVQVAGRAGRADRPGEVLIQSRHASHAALQSLTTLSYRELAGQLLDERRMAGMPPLSHLALLRAEARDAPAGLRFLDSAERQARALCDRHGLKVECLGPLPAPMEKRGGRYRSQLLLKSQQRGHLQNLLEPLLIEMEALRTPAGLRWGLDVDPTDLI